ncbi:hypothetical protein [Sulfuracidifex metallicus]
MKCSKCDNEASIRIAYSNIILCASHLWNGWSRGLKERWRSTRCWKEQGS